MNACALWRRLDAPGFDACHLTTLEQGWRLHGTAVFKGPVGPASLSYEVECDETWHTLRGSVLGWSGAHAIDLQILRLSGGEWTLNGAVMRLDGCADLDFGFTPATNLLQLRRIALEIGGSADVPVAWLDVDSRTLERLDQRYERRSARDYWYDAERFDYHAVLEVNTSGFVDNYPHLWEAVA